MKLLAIKTNLGYFITDDENHSRHLNDYKFDGVHPKKTYTIGWYSIIKLPKIITLLGSRKTINKRFELVDGSLQSDKIPYSFEATSQNTTKYENVKSLYEFKCDVVAAQWEPVEFTCEVILEVEGIGEHPEIEYKTIDVAVTGRNIKHQLIDEIIFPDVVLSSKPSAFTSKQVYDIVREHIKRNINPKFATIPSDHNFCFSVEKVIPLTESISYQYNLNKFHSRRKEKLETRYRTDRRAVCFEMTHDEEKYRGHTVIPSLVGKNHTDLKNKMDKFLKNLMKRINEPIKDCPHCHGDGVLIDSKEKLRNMFTNP